MKFLYYFCLIFGILFLFLVIMSTVTNLTKPGYIADLQAKEDGYVLGYILGVLIFSLIGIIPIIVAVRIKRKIKAKQLTKEYDQFLK